MNKILTAVAVVALLGFITAGLRHESAPTPRASREGTATTRQTSSPARLAQPHAQSIAYNPPASVAPPHGPSLSKPAPAVQARLQQAYGKLPLSFEVNEGQAAQPVKFISRGSGYSLFLTPTEAVLSLHKDEGGRIKDERGPLLDPSSFHLHPSAKAPAVLRMKLVGANPKPQVSGVDQLPGKSNYFIGNDPKKWRTNVSLYGKVKYAQAYPGIDLIYYSNQSQLEYDFVVAPGVDPNRIRMKFAGAHSVSIDGHGQLILDTGSGKVVQHAPIIYQETKDGRRNVAGAYVLGEQQQVGFRMAAFEHSKPLVIDPVLVYSTYLGGGGDDRGWGIAVDSSGNAYVTGQTISTNFPTQRPIQGTYGDGNYIGDAFVSKLNASDSALSYSTYLGGSGDDRGQGIAIDSSGNAYVTGFTGSTDFPTQSPFQGTYGGGSWDAFVSKLNASGSALSYSTYLGGSGFDEGYGMCQWK